VVPDLPGDIVDTAWSWVEQLPDTMHASMLDDLLRGKPLENDWLSGDVVRIGREAGVPTPIHAVFHAALAPFAAGAP
jgi:2-dehydropantoate 2-reductase